MIIHKRLILFFIAVFSEYGVIFASIFALEEPWKILPGTLAVVALYVIVLRFMNGGPR